METPRSVNKGSLPLLITDQIHLDVEYEEGHPSRYNSMLVISISGREVLLIQLERSHRSGDILQADSKST